MGKKATPDGFPTTKRWNMCHFHFCSGLVFLELSIKQLGVLSDNADATAWWQEVEQQASSIHFLQSPLQPVGDNFFPYKSFMVSWVESLAGSKTSRGSAAWRKWEQIWNMSDSWVIYCWSKCKKVQGPWGHMDLGSKPCSSRCKLCDLCFLISAMTNPTWHRACSLHVSSIPYSWLLLHLLKWNLSDLWSGKRFFPLTYRFLYNDKIVFNEIKFRCMHFLITYFWIERQ